MVKMCNMKKAVLFFVLAGVGFVCGCASEDKNTAIRVENYTETIRVACVGDSITYGSGIKDRLKDGYPAQLGRMLGDRWEVRNFGHSGTTVLKRSYRPYWDQAVFREATAFNPDVVIIKLGTNDASESIWSRQKDEFVGDYEALIDHFAGLASKPEIRICYPVPIYSGASWAGHEERRLNLEEEIIPLIKEIAERKNVPVIDLYRPLSGKRELFPDTVHPNAEGAGLMAEEIYKSLTGKAVKVKLKVDF